MLNSKMMFGYLISCIYVQNDFVTLISFTQRCSHFALNISGSRLYMITLALSLVLKGALPEMDFPLIVIVFYYLSMD